MRYSGACWASQAALALILVGCGSREGGTVPSPAAGTTQAPEGLRHVSLRVRAAGQGGHCPAVSIKIEPLHLSGAAQPPATRQTSYTDLALKPMVGAAQASFCEGTALSAPLASGAWRLSVALPAGLLSCERAIAASVDVAASFEEGKAGCE
jgi:hypothetical protein